MLIYEFTSASYYEGTKLRTFVQGTSYLRTFEGGYNS